MTAFEHVVVLLSFVYALALTHVLSSFAELAMARGRLRISGLQLLWMLNVLALTFVNWLGIWDLRRLKEWDVAQVALVFVFGVASYFASVFVSPRVPATGDVDMEAFRTSHKRLYVGVVLGLGVLSLFVNWAQRDAYVGNARVDWIAQDLAVLPMIAMAAVALAPRPRWLEWTAGLGLLAILAAAAATFTFG